MPDRSLRRYTFAEKLETKVWGNASTKLWIGMGRNNGLSSHMNTMKLRGGPLTVVFPWHHSNIAVTRDSVYLEATISPSPVQLKRCLRNSEILLLCSFSVLEFSQTSLNSQDGKPCDSVCCLKKLYKCVTVC